MQDVPELPQDWENWMKKVGFLQNHIFFGYNRKGVTHGFCTWCEKDVPVKNPKHNQYGEFSCCHHKIKYKSINKVQSVITELTTPKTANSYRAIPFFGETEECLKSWKRKQDECKKRLGSRWRARTELGDLVFTSTVGSPVTRYVIAHDLKKIVQNINLKEYSKAIRDHRAPVEFEHLHPRAFCHTFATRCFEKGKDSLFVQSIMGHANYATTVSYTHVLDDMRQKEVAKVGNFLESPTCV